MTKRASVVGTAVCAALLTGCVMIPTAPMVTVLPGSTKAFEDFRYDDVDCRNYAYSTIAGPSQAAANTAAANAAAGTAIGAAAGAIIGSATGNAGSGAAIGAGTGLLFGSAAGANGYYYSSYGLQRQYDTAYIQCMYAKGNRVPARFVAGYGATYGSPQYSAPPPDAGAPPDRPASGYPPPNSSQSSIPPPNTPPPRN